AAGLAERVLQEADRQQNPEFSSRVASAAGNPLQYRNATLRNLVEERVHGWRDRRYQAGSRLDCVLHRARRLRDQVVTRPVFVHPDDPGQFVIPEIRIAGARTPDEARRVDLAGSRRDEYGSV